MENWKKQMLDELKAVQEELEKWKHEADDAYAKGDEKRFKMAEARVQYFKRQSYQLHCHLIEVGKKISISPYTDWQSYTIIRRTKDALYARADRQLHFIKDWMDGYRACEEDPNGEVIRLTWGKVSKMWCYKDYKVCVGERNYEDPSF
jgi:hypothetical protein